MSAQAAAAEAGETWHPVYSAGKQAAKVRFLTGFSFLSALGASWGGLNLFQTGGLAPADGGVLWPLPVRLAWGIGFALVGILFALGMVVYGHHYVTRLDVDPAGRRLRIRTLLPWGARGQEVPLERLQGAAYAHGSLETLDHSVRAPWYSLRIEGRRTALILDAQGDRLDPKQMRRLLRQEKGKG